MKGSDASNVGIVLGQPGGATLILFGAEADGCRNEEGTSSFPCSWMGKETLAATTTFLAHLTSTGPTPSVGPIPPTIGPTPSVVGPTPDPSMEPTLYIHPSPSIPTPSFVPSSDVHQLSDNPTNPADMVDPAPHDRPFIEPWGKDFFLLELLHRPSLGLLSNKFFSPGHHGEQSLGNKKGRLCGLGQLASNYSAGRGGILKHQPSTSDTSDQSNVVSREAYDSLLARFDNLENLVKTLLPQQGQSAPSSSQQPCPPQQPS
ncbi:hypothetical protein LR48_Vigan11g067100 [Vigna angularis]|uniref:Uncharacterized protein n=1 Tax=Phaseolus angularis TaxID=3914 RepID=A0A0L9VRR3_PHAAN|nr:hypothetical protein LR48_Vigan11g067100 [Vigna angularis]